tara:strand:+ start:112 stop:747 length:636 start_codon:yes stop_codon:yes gene_type:complete
MQQRKGRKFRRQREKPEFDQQIIDLARVTRVTEGGKQLSFRVCIIIGDRKGRVGYGVAKGKDVQIAVEKAVTQAKKNLITIPLVNDTIPHKVLAKFKAAKIMIKPAPQGSGIIAGGATRSILDLAGVPNASAKTLGKTNNKLTNTMATFAALHSFLPHAVALAKEQSAKKKAKKVEKEAVVKTEEKKEEKKAPKKTTKKRVTKKTDDAAKA